VPWHQDATIEIEKPSTTDAAYSPPRCKAGIWHCEPPVEVLERMLALRLHLDSVTNENGPLEVCPGTHRTGRQFDLSNKPIVRILATAGDVLLMRPLLAHASIRSRPQATQHRRVIHLEFTADAELPGSYRWRRFVR
jgi:ectoine hydroxylase-related dioxygenase (phytanoyl-CoA dioxygenase family)